MVAALAVRKQPFELRTLDDVPDDFAHTAAAQDGKRCHRLQGGLEGELVAEGLHGRDHVRRNGERLRLEGFDLGSQFLELVVECALGFSRLLF